MDESSIGSYNNVIVPPDVAFSDVSSSHPSGNTSMVSSLGTSAGYSVVHVEAVDVASIIAESEQNVSFPSETSTVVSERTYAPVSISPKPDDASSFAQSDVSGATGFVAYKHA